MEFHNSSPARSLSPPPSPPTLRSPVAPSPVRVSVIKHTKDQEDTQENIKHTKEQEETKENEDGAERKWEKAREKYPDFSSFCSLEVRSPPTESSYTQKQEIFVKCKNTDREGERAPVISLSPKSPINLNQAMQRPVILPKMKIGTNVFQQPSSSARREKNFSCSHGGCDKSYYKLSHLKAHFRVHTGRQTDR